MKILGKALNGKDRVFCIPGVPGKQGPEEFLYPLGYGLDVVSFKL